MSAPVSRGAVEDECWTAAEAIRAGVPGRKVLVVAVTVDPQGNYFQTMRTSCDENPNQFEQTRLLAGLAATAVELVDIWDPYR